MLVDGHYRFIDHMGSVAVPGDYVFGRRFREGLAHVWTKSKGRLVSAYINRGGKRIWEGTCF